VRGGEGKTKRVCESEGEGDREGGRERERERKGGGREEGGLDRRKERKVGRVGEREGGGYSE
jgi:hypothetical protein